ncbi:MAG: CDC48 family AAA ATPase [Desulfurococcaceae archaeon]
MYELAIHTRQRLILRVIDVQPQDSGKGVARLDPLAMSDLEVVSGDIIEVEGRRKTVVRAIEGSAEDRGLGIIRLDKTTRRNAGVDIGGRVSVAKASATIASIVKIAPSRFQATVDKNFVRFIKARLLERPLIEGDIVTIYTLGQELPFKVVYTKPKGPVVIKDSTNLVILERPTEEYGIPRVTYEDIGDLGEAKQKIREIVELPLKFPEAFKKLGIEPPKGILLYGPPGCGKTLLAKAVANETNAFFIAVNGPEIMSKFYGESEQKLREIFEQAKKNAPAIVFIDEVDSIAPKRDEVIGEVERRVVAQLLALMDGLESRGEVIVIAATNRPSAVDPALRRPGRFDREIEVPLPDKQGRLEILQIHVRGVPLASDVDLAKLAEITRGYTGADLAALVREAALHALRRYLPQIDLDSSTISPELLERMEVRMEDFMAAFREIVPSGLREIYVEIPEVRWSDVGGLSDLKQQLRLAVEWPLKYPEAFKKLGIEPPKGILLYGPPGCGKTLLAKAVATESGANFIAVRGPEVLSKWVGESEKAIREIFKKARTYAPAVIFFDEIDSIAPVRGLVYDSGVTERVVAQLITEMDGLVELDNVIVIGASNRPDLIDPALLRPGRLDLILYVPPPDRSSRLEILKVHTRKMPLAEDVDLDELADKTEGFSGADLASLVKQAAMEALLEDVNAKVVCRRHFIKALESVKPSITPELEKTYKMWAEKFRQSLPKSYLRPTIYT